ncbi:hypothetical protein ES703_121791 [subsurface metagenome]
MGLTAAGHGLCPPEVRLAVAAPVPTGKELGNIAKLIHGLRDLQVVTVLRLEICLIVLVGEEMTAIEQRVSVAIER